MDVTATEFKRKMGQYMDAAERNPVIIKKSGRVKSVLISSELYEKFLALEDAYWAQLAKQAEAGGYLGEDQTEKLLKRIAADV
jgi:prevent-host-death family protein